MLVGTNPWLVVLMFVFMVFVVAVFCAKKDSAMRAIVYTFILGILVVYLLFNHLLPEIRHFHSLIPADCMVTEPAKVMAYNSEHGPVHFLLVPVNVSHIDCHGDIGHSIDVTNSEGVSGWSSKMDKQMCKTGTTIKDGVTAYMRMDNWYMLDGDERNFTVTKWEQGKRYFCWSDATIPDYVTFENQQDWTAIMYPLACLALLFYLCHAAGSFVLIGECCNLVACDPWFLRIDAKTPVATLKRMRGEYTEV